MSKPPNFRTGDAGNPSTAPPLMTDGSSLRLDSDHAGATNQMTAEHDDTTPKTPLAEMNTAPPSKKKQRKAHDKRNQNTEAIHHNEDNHDEDDTNS